MYYHNFIIFFNLTEALPSNQRSIRQVCKCARKGGEPDESPNVFRTVW